MYKTLFFLAAVILPVWLTGCSEPTVNNQLEDIKSADVLKVGTVFGTKTYFIGKADKKGFEYELVKGFADTLNVNVEVTVFSSFAALNQALITKQIDLAMPGEGVPAFADSTFKSGPTLKWVSQVIVSGNELLCHTTPSGITVVAGSAAAQTVSHDNLNGIENPDIDAHELLASAASGTLNYVAVDSDSLAIQRQRYANLCIHSTLASQQPVAWQLAGDTDDALLGALYEYFHIVRSDGRLADLQARYFSRSEHTRPADVSRFLDLANRTPALLASTFVSSSSDVDWQLLAAMAYATHPWRGRAATPFDSTPLENALAQIPARISSPDRLWMAIAATHSGFIHLQDARTLTSEQGGDADDWVDVKQRYPLLTQKHYYQHASAGFVQGDDTVQFVENVRAYYAGLKALTNNQ